MFCPSCKEGDEITGKKSAEQRFKAPPHAGKPELVFRHRGIDLVGPGQDAALEVIEVIEAKLLLKQQNGIATAGTAATVYHHLLVAGDLVGLAFYLGQGNQLAA